MKLFHPVNGCTSSGWYVNIEDAFGKKICPICGTELIVKDPKKEEEKKD